jgi:hypothetical protein
LKPWSLEALRPWTNPIPRPRWLQVADYRLQVEVFWGMESREQPASFNL